MGWFDANEYVLIATMAENRVDDLLSSTELALERAAIADQRVVGESAHVCDARGSELGRRPV